MLILLFVLVPILVVVLYAGAQALRNRQPSSIESGVDAFRREMTALSPDAAPVQRRPGERPPAAPGAQGGGAAAPRRPGPPRPGAGGDEAYD